MIDTNVDHSSLCEMLVLHESATVDRIMQEESCFFGHLLVYINKRKDKSFIFFLFFPFKSTALK